MFDCSIEEFRKFVLGTANLCGDGMVTSEYCRFFKIDFNSSRSQLLESYADFSACCSWLSGCRFDDYATHYSPGSDRLLSQLNKALGRPVPHGALIAAVLYLELPHVIPGTSPGIAVGVSRFCSRLQGQALNPVC